MDLTVKDWRGLCQGLHVDFYAFFSSPGQISVFKSYCHNALGDTKLSQLWIVCVSASGPQSFPQRIPIYNKQCTRLLDKKKKNC